MSGRLRPGRVAALSTVTALLVAVAGASSAGAAPPAGPSAIGSGQVVARASAGYSLEQPAILTMRNRTTVLAWTETGRTPHRLRVLRQRGSSHWQSGTLSVGALDTLGTVSLLEDRTRGRLLLTSLAYDSTDTGSTVGTWLWVSRDSGRTWTAPARVWDSVGTSRTATDGVGGFWLVTESTGLWLAHVPAALTTQHWPGDETSMTDRISSRSIVDVTTVGRSRVPVTYFSDADAAWVHLGTGAGQGGDRQLAASQPLDAAVAGTATVARVVTGSTSGPCPVCLWDITPTASDDVRVGHRRRVGSRTEATHNVALATLLDAHGRETARSAVAWLTDAGRVELVEASPRAVGKPRTLARFPSGGHVLPEALAVSARWVVVLSHAAGDLHSVFTAVRL